MFPTQCLLHPNPGHTQIKPSLVLSLGCSRPLKAFVRHYTIFVRSSHDPREAALPPAFHP